jgi:Ca2+-binding EF-hand superfamily protein
MTDAVEEKYLRMRDDHTALKKKCNEQQDTIKRMYTKLAMIEENLKRKDRGGAMPSPERRGGQKESASDKIVVDLRNENKELKKKCTLLTAKCRKFAVQLKKERAGGAKGGTSGAGQNKVSGLEAAVNLGGDNSLEDHDLEKQLQHFAAQARGAHNVKQTQELMGALRARLVTAEKQLVWLRQENQALQNATEVATRKKPGMGAGASAIPNAEVEKDILSLERELREKNAKITLLTSRYDQLRSKSDATKEIQQNSMIQLEEFNRTIRDLRRQLQYATHEKDTLTMQAARAKELEQDLEQARQQSRKAEQRMAALVDDLGMDAGFERKERVDKIFDMERRDRQQKLSITQLKEMAQTHHEAMLALQDAVKQLRADKDASTDELERLREQYQEQQQLMEERGLHRQIYANTKPATPRSVRRSRPTTPRAVVERPASPLRSSRRSEQGMGVMVDADDVNTEDLQQAMELISQLRDHNPSTVDFLDDDFGGGGVGASGEDGVLNVLSTAQMVPKLRKKLQLMNVAHLNSLRELERVERMLQAQVDINRDLNAELDEAQKRRTADSSTLQAQLGDMELLAEKRLKRVEQLSAMLKDKRYSLAGGVLPPGGQLGDEDEDGNLTGKGRVKEDDLALAYRGEYSEDSQNLVEVWVVSASLDENYVHQGATTFMMIDFFDYESMPTQLLQGLTPAYDFATTYKVDMEDYLLRHFLTDSLTIELNQASVSHADFQVLAQCHVPLVELLTSPTAKIERKRAPLIAVEGSGIAAGTVVGEVRLLVRLAVPVIESFKTYLKEHPQERQLYQDRLDGLHATAGDDTALRVMSTEEGAAMAAADVRATGQTMNEIEVVIESCENLQGLKGGRPSAYVHYQLMSNFEDVFTPPVPESADPVFGHRERFPVRADQRMLEFLKRMTLPLAVFDDSDSAGIDDDDRYGDHGLLGTAQVKMGALAYGEEVSGEFEIRNSNREFVGTLKMTARWLSPLHDPGSASNVRLKPNELSADQLSLLTERFGLGDGSVDYRAFLLFADPPRELLQLETALREAIPEYNGRGDGGEGAEAPWKGAIRQIARAAGASGGVGVEEMMTLVKELRIVSMQEADVESAFVVLKRQLLPDGSEYVPATALLEWAEPPSHRMRMLEDKLRSHLSARPVKGEAMALFMALEPEQHAQGADFEMGRGGGLMVHNGKISRGKFKQAMKKLGLALQGELSAPEGGRGGRGGKGKGRDEKRRGSGREDTVNEELLLEQGRGESEVGRRGACDTATEDPIAIERARQDTQRQKEKAEFEAAMNEAGGTSKVVIPEKSTIKKAVELTENDPRTPSGKAPAGFAEGVEVSREDEAASVVQKRYRGFRRGKNELDDPGGVVEAAEDLGGVGVGAGGPMSSGNLATSLEVEEALMRGSSDVAPADIQAACQELDASGRGEVETRQFFAIVSGQRGYAHLEEPLVRALCYMFDARGDGTMVNYVAFLKFIKYEKPKLAPAIRAMRRMRLQQPLVSAMEHYVRRDSDRSGTISLNNFDKCIRATLASGSADADDGLDLDGRSEGEVALPKALLRDIASMLDLDGTHMVYYRPFVEYVAKYQPSLRVRRVLDQLRVLQQKAEAHQGMALRDFFVIFDKERAGSISAAQFAEGVKGLGLDLSSHDVRLLWSRLGDGAAGGAGKSEMTLADLKQLLYGARLALLNSVTEEDLGELQKRARNVVRDAVFKRGLDIQTAFNTQFKHFDYHGLKFIHVDEFCTAVDRCGFNFTEEESLFLATHFAHQGSGGDELQQGVDYLKCLEWATVFKSDSCNEVERRLWDSLLREATAKGKSMSTLTTQLREAFARAAEADGGGSGGAPEIGSGLSRVAFVRTCRGLELPLGAEELRTLMDEYDPDHKDEVRYLNFLQRGQIHGGGGGGGGADTEDRMVPAGDGEDAALQDVMDKLRQLVRKADSKGVDFRESFEHFDADKDGMLDRREFQEGMEKLGFRIDANQTKRLMRKFGNTDGGINYRDFLRALAPPDAETELDKDIAQTVRNKLQSEAWKRGDLVSLFRTIDRDGSGKLDAREFRRALEKMRLDLSKSEVKNLMSGFDHNGDGFISYAEFVEFVTGKGAESVEKAGLLPSDVLERWTRVVGRWVDKGVDYCESFVKEDTDHEGVVVRSALKRLLRELGGGAGAQQLESGDVEQMCSVYESEAAGVGNVSYMELLHAAQATSRRNKRSQSQWLTEEKLRRLIRKKAGDFSSPGSLAIPFNHFDSSKRGTFKVSDLRRGLERLKLTPSEDQIDAMFALMDLHNSGSIGMSEFAVFVRDPFHDQVARKSRGAVKRSPGGVQDLEAEFTRCDRNRTGKVTGREFQRVLQKLGVDLSSRDVRRIASRFDPKDDGRIKYKDFILFCDDGAVVDRDRDRDDDRGRDVDRLEDRASETVAKLKQLVRKATRKGVDLRESFEHFDTNRDGEIDEREFRNGLERLGFDLTRGEASEMMAMFGRGGRIKYRDFIRAIDPAEEEKLDEEVTELVSRRLIREGRRRGEMLSVFEAIDGDGSGYVTQREFVRGMEKLGLGLETRDVKRVFAKFDRDRAGKVSYNEFVRAVEKHTGDRAPTHADDEDELAMRVQKKLRRSDEDLDRLFRKFDENNSGRISEREFLRAMDKLRLDLTDKEARKLMSRFDTDNSGSISYREFIRFAEGRGGVSSPRKAGRARPDDSDRSSRNLDAELDDDYELSAKVRKIIRRRDENLDRVFREFDRNGDGEVSEREFLRAMDKLRLDLTDKEARKLMSRFDTDNSGRISYREFIRHLEN